MVELVYRRARRSDLPAMAEIRSKDWGTEGYWQIRIRQYLAHQLSPRQALRPRLAFVSLEGDSVVGFIAGHLTRRFDCQGELEWISVRAEYRGHGIASELLRRMAAWFIVRKARRVCVDVEPSNEVARRFYAHHGAGPLKPHWMVWNDIESVLRAEAGLTSQETS